MAPQTVSPSPAPSIELASKSIQPSNTTDDESNGFVIITDKKPLVDSSSTLNKITPKNEKQIKKPTLVNTPSADSKENSSHIRSNTFQQNKQDNNQIYDSSLGIVLNVDNLDKDTGENKYKRRPLFEWLARWLKYLL
jgi:hypothetical protein